MRFVVAGEAGHDVFFVGLVVVSLLEVPDLFAGVDVDAGEGGFLGWAGVDEDGGLVGE